MYSKTQMALKWFKYYILAASSRGHGIHSPFVYSLVREVLMDRRTNAAFVKIEGVKRSLRKDKRIIPVYDLGTGGKKFVKKQTTVSAIARRSLSTKKFGRLLYRLANHYQAKNIFELGSSLGISASYLASAGSGSSVITMEGSAAIAAVAAETFQRLDLKNVKLVTGGFDENLENVIAENQPADFLFLDGNHSKKPVLDYFEQFLARLAPSAVIIIHDIHWSREMEEAWSAIQDHPKVKMSIDIFSAGLIFIRDDFKVRQQFVLRY